MATVTVTFEILDSELAEGWRIDGRTPELARAELARSVVARLSEVITDTADVVQPEVVSVDVEETGDLHRTVWTRGGVFDVVEDDKIDGDAEDVYREYRRELRRRGFEVAVGSRDLEDEHVVHVPTGRFLQGRVSSGFGVEVRLWDDFHAGFTRDDFDTLQQYLDEFEERFAALWRMWDEG